MVCCDDDGPFSPGVIYKQLLAVHAAHKEATYHHPDMGFLTGTFVLRLVTVLCFWGLRCPPALTACVAYLLLACVAYLRCQRDFLFSRFAIGCTALPQAEKF